MKYNLFGFFRLHKHLIFDLSGVIVLTLVFLSLLFRHLFHNPFYYFAADNSEMYFPMWVYLNKSIHQFYFPLRNQFWYLGSIPFASVETSAFYLPYILVQFLFDASKNLDTAYFYFLGMELGHYVLAAVGMYLFLSLGLKLKRFACVFGALIYAVSGTFIGRFVHTPYILQLAWLPFLFLTYFLYLEKRKPVFIIFCSVVLSFILNAGHQQVAFYIISFFLMAVLYFSLAAGKNRIKILLSSGMIFLVAGLLSAPKLLLSFELSQNIVRMDPGITLKNLFSSIEPSAFLAFFIPHIFGQHILGYWGSAIPWGDWEYYVYIGIIPLLAIPFIFWWRKRAMMVFFLSAFVFSIIMSWGKYFPLSAYLNQHMPFAENFGFVSRILDMSHFFLAILAAVGFHVLEKYKLNRKTFLLISLLIIVTGLEFMVTPLKEFPRINLALNDPDKIRGLELAANSLAFFKLMYPVSFFLIVLFALAKKRIWYLLIIIFYALDIFITSGNYNPIETSPGEPFKYFGKTYAVTELKPDMSIYRVFNLWPRNISMIQNIESTDGYHTLRTKSFQNIAPFIDPKRKGIMNLLNIKYLMTGDDLSKLDSSYRSVGSGLWQNSTVFNRVFYVPHYHLENSRNELIHTLLSDTFNPSQTVLLDSVESTVYRLPDYESFSSNIESVEPVINQYTNDRIEVSVSLVQPGFLVFSQPQYPGWVAKLDGQNKKLLSAYGSVYALPITSGKHTVVFEYRSILFGWGILFCSLTVLTICILFVNPKSKKYLYDTH